MPRVFGIFFNQDHNAVLSDVSVRKALEDSVDKQSVVDSVLADMAKFFRAHFHQALSVTSASNHQWLSHRYKKRSCDSTPATTGFADADVLIFLKVAGVYRVRPLAGSRKTNAFVEARDRR